MSEKECECLHKDEIEGDTTVRISRETRDLLELARKKFQYHSMNDLILDFLDLDERKSIQKRICDLERDMKLLLLIWDIISKRGFSRPPEGS